MENSRDNQLKLMRKLVEDLCTSGKPSLNEDKAKALRKICKKSDYYIVELYQILTKHLRKKHAEIRLSAFQICNDIFLRSHCFRELVLKNFNMLIEYTVGLNSKKPLPSPAAAATKLKETAIGAIQNWYDKFKDGYKALKLGYKFLRDCRNVDFEALAIVTELDRQRIEEQRRKEEDLKKRRVDRVTEEMEELSTEFTTTIAQFNNGFKLLIPDLHEFFVANENDSDSSVIDSGFDEELKVDEESIENIEYGSHWMREHGINKDTTVQVNLADIHKIQENHDNEIIILTLKEQVANIEKTLLPKVKTWEQSVLPYSSSEAEMIKKIVNMKQRLESVLKRFYSIKFMPQIKLSSGPDIGTETDSDDDDFIDVPFDDPRIVQAVESEAALFQLDGLTMKANIDKLDLDEAGPSGLNCSSGSTRNINNSSKRAKSYPDIDIESSKLEEHGGPSAFRSSMTGLNQVWTANEALHDHEDGTLKPSGLLGIATRPINYEREWEPVKWECRHPLPSGRLCPRRDRECCPFHGPVVPRDEVGKPLSSKDAARDNRRQELYERKYPSWQDPSLLADIRANTGIDLDMRKAKQRKRKYPNLTDLRKLKNTPRNRLAKKVLSKNSVRILNKKKR